VDGVINDIIAQDGRTEISLILIYPAGYNWSFQRWKEKLLKMISIEFFSIGSCDLNFLEIFILN